MQLYRRISATVLVVIVLVSITASCFAIGGAVTITVGDMFGAAASMYGAAHGFGVESSVNGVQSSFSNPMGRTSWNDVNLMSYREYYNSKSAQEICSLGLISPDNWDLNYNNTSWFDLVDLVEEYQDGVYSVVTLPDTTSEMFDDYYNWLLVDKLGLSRDSTTGVFLLPNSQYSIPIASSSSVSYDDIELYELQIGDSVTYSPFDGVSPYQVVQNISSSDPVYVMRQTGKIAFVSNSQFTITIRKANQFTEYLNSNTTALDSSYAFPYGVSTTGATQSYNQSFPYIEWNLNHVNDLPMVTNGETVDSTSNILEIVTNTGIVEIPDSTDENYEPAPLVPPLNVPYNQDKDIFISDAIDQILSNELELVEDSPVPSPPPDDITPIVAPFLPFNLPSFNFNLSGIWHYVREFVSSIGSGFSLIRSAWSALPYAMVVPIYASLVCVIVIGLWRRFFE